MLTINHIKSITLILIPITIIYTFIHILLEHIPLSYALIKGENGFGENLTFLCFFIIGIKLTTELSKNKNSSRFYYPLIIWFFLAALEEISYGQQLFFKKHSFLKEWNSQSEINLHNLTFFENVRYLEEIFFSFPLLYILTFKKHFSNIIKNNLRTITFLIVLITITTYSYYIYGEMKELLFALGYFYLFFTNIKKINFYLSQTALILTALSLTYIIKGQLIQYPKLNKLEYLSFTNNKPIDFFYKMQKKNNTLRDITEMRYYSKLADLPSPDKLDLKNKALKLSKTNLLLNHLKAAIYFNILNLEDEYKKINYEILNSKNQDSTLTSLSYKIIAAHNLNKMKLFNQYFLELKNLSNENTFSAKKSRYIKNKLYHLNLFKNVRPGKLTLYIRDPFHNLKKFSTDQYQN